MVILYYDYLVSIVTLTTLESIFMSAAGNTDNKK